MAGIDAAREGLLAARVSSRALVGIGDRIVAGDPRPIPSHGTWSLVEDAVP